jgi:hypothetical protein
MDQETSTTRNHERRVIQTMNYKTYGAARPRKGDKEKKPAIEDNFNGANIEDLLKGPMPEKVVRPDIKNVGPFNSHPDPLSYESAMKKFV